MIRMSDGIGGMKASEVSRFVKDNLSQLLVDRDYWMEVLGNDSRSSVRDLCSFISREENRISAEIARVRALYDFDARFGNLVAGVDEVGRGPLAGPIVGAAVVLRTDSPDKSLILEINDSKKLSRKKREELFEKIKEQAEAFAIYEMSNLDIDRIGISYCNHEVFRGSLRQIGLKVDMVLSDGYPIKDFRGRNTPVIKGDTKSAAIACASIIAKVHRDRIMENLHAYYPQYGFDSNVGYGSQVHIEALKRLGPCPIHRMSFLTGILEKNNMNE
jgi:ribonuclease HII